MAEFAPYRPGWQFKDGKLLQFGKAGVTVLRGWPEPMAWQKRLGGSWRHVRPKLELADIRWAASGEPVRHLEESFAAEAGRDGSTQLTLPFVTADRQRILAGMRAREQAARAFLATIPEEVVGLVSRFTNRQWHVLALLARCPGADDVARTCPALAFALASNWVFHKPAVKRPLRSARSLLRRPRPKALAWLGFPGTRSAARQLAKVPPGEVNVGLLLDLRRALQDEDTRRYLAHLPTIRHDVVRLVRTPELMPYVGPSLLLEWSEAPRTWRGARLYVLLRDTLEMAAVWGGRVPRFRTLEQVLRHHDERVGNLSQRELERYARVALPDPPLVGNAAIEPLADSRSVIEEGRAMGHCAATYVPAIARGRSYLYRVVKPERATLELRMSRRGWQVVQLQGARNGRVGAETWKTVHAWLGSDRPTRVPEAVEVPF